MKIETAVFQIMLFMVLTLPAYPESACHEDDWRCKAAENYFRADAELNRVYQAVLKAIDESDLSEAHKLAWKEQQRKAQRLWIRFRDEDCAIIDYTWMGGTGLSSAMAGCKQLLTEQRIESLKANYWR